MCAALAHRQGGDLLMTVERPCQETPGDLHGL
jgi:hypothetical protein